MNTSTTLDVLFHGNILHARALRTGRFEVSVSIHPNLSGNQVSFCPQFRQRAVNPHHYLTFCHFYCPVISANLAFSGQSSLRPILIAHLPQSDKLTLKAVEVVAFVILGWYYKGYKLIQVSMCCGRLIHHGNTTSNHAHAHAQTHTYKLSVSSL